MGSEELAVTGARTRLAISISLTSSSSARSRRRSMRSSLRIVARRQRGGDASQADVALVRRSSEVEPLDAHEAGLALAVDAEQPTPPVDLVGRWLSGL